MPNTAATTTHDPTTLVCPKCQAPMEKVEFGRVSVDRCPICEGLWFDKNEHERLKDLTGSEAIDAATGNAQTPDVDVQSMKCPRCDGPMTVVQDAEQPHIEYEMCQAGHGVFFDAGEFRDFKEVTLVESIGQLWRQWTE